MNRSISASPNLGSQFRVWCPTVALRLLLAIVSIMAARTATAAFLFVSDENSSTIEKISPTGAVTNFASGIFTGGGPYDLAFDRNGNLLVANPVATSPGTILKYTPAGSRSVFFNAASYFPVSLAFDATGRLFTGDTIISDISIITTTGAKLPFASGLNPERLAFDTNGNLFAADITGVIYKFTPSGARSVFANASNNRSGLAFDAHGNLFASNYLGGGIDEYTPSGAHTTFATGLSFPDGLAFDSSGNLYEADAGSGNIFKFSPTGARSTFASGLQGPTYLAFSVPEPSSMILLAIGGLALGGVAIARRRGRRAKSQL
jgi:PEP-CTERM motif